MCKTVKHPRVWMTSWLQEKDRHLKPMQYCCIWTWIFQEHRILRKKVFFWLWFVHDIHTSMVLYSSKFRCWERCLPLHMWNTIVVMSPNPWKWFWRRMTSTRCRHGLTSSWKTPGRMERPRGEQDHLESPATPWKHVNIPKQFWRFKSKVRG